MLVKLYFHNGEKNKVQVPKEVKLIHDGGVQFTCVMDGPRKRVYGQVLTVQGEKSVIDSWLKDQDVYIDSASLKDI